MDDLWPDHLQTVAPYSPVRILKEQAALLGEKTKNIVQASLRISGEGSSSAKPFLYSFSIDCPALSYHYRVFSVALGFEPYPVSFRIDGDIRKEISPDTPEGVSLSAESEQDFVSILGKILQSEKTKKIVASLVAHAQAGEV
ncbi:MAG: hypothetical protein HY913_21455 [Desulfomonile tiedjei]|nr:hypothetical protein [Desulfomonile tiedjei]